MLALGGLVYLHIEIVEFERTKVILVFPHSQVCNRLVDANSGQQKPWFRFRFYRNPKVSVSTETQIEQKPKPKL